MLKIGGGVTDQYQLTMGVEDLRKGLLSRFYEMFVRSYPKNRGFLVTAGLQQALEYMRDLRFDEETISYLFDQQAINDEMAAYLADFRFQADVDALPEGTVAPPQTPLLRVMGNSFEGSLVESAALAIVGHQTMIASKTARIVNAAQGRPVWDFSLRRLHGPGHATEVARAAFIAGAAGSATVAAGVHYGIPTTGTMAHRYIMAFGEENEQQAFEEWLRNRGPKWASLLVDTYDTLRGVSRGIAASQNTGVPLKAIRLDSGDLGELAKGARALLDAAGMQSTKIMATNDLDEWKIENLLADGAPIDVYGAGTMLGTSNDAAALGIVYKNVGSDDQPYVMKKAPGKQTDPGCHQVWRTENGLVLGMDDEDLDGEPLMRPVMRNGEILDLPTLPEIQAYARKEIDSLPDGVKRLTDPDRLTLTRSKKLWEIRASLGDVEAQERLASGPLV